ncbi:MAG: glycosyltransferase family 9 protein [Candidatus Firestonebacteria bacterium]
MRSFKPEEIKRILFVRLRFIGDVIISTSVISDLRKKYPNIKLDYLAEKMPLKMLENNPDINELVEAEKGNIIVFIKTILKIRKKRYDAVIDVFGNPRSALLTYFSGAKYKIGWNIKGRSFCYNTIIQRRDVLDPSVKSDCLDAYEDAVRLFGIEKSGRKTKLYLSGSELDFGEGFKKEKLLKDQSVIIGIQPGCRRGESLTWPKEKYAELADRLIVSGFKVLIFGGPADKNTNAFVLNKMKNSPIIVETRGIREDLAVMNICSCFVTNNHGPVHMAAALNVPTVGLYRPDEVFLWFPYRNDRSKVLYNISICGECMGSGCQNIKCITDPKVEEVYSAVLELINKKDGGGH